MLLAILAGRMEEIYEGDYASVQMVRSDSAGVHGWDSAQLRIDGRRDEICSARPVSYRANSLSVTASAPVPERRATLNVSVVKKIIGWLFKLQLQRRAWNASADCRTGHDALRRRTLR